MLAMRSLTSMLPPLLCRRGAWRFLLLAADLCILKALCSQASSVKPTAHSGRGAGVIHRRPALIEELAFGARPCARHHGAPRDARLVVVGSRCCPRLVARDPLAPRRRSEAQCLDRAGESASPPTESPAHRPPVQAVIGARPRF